ncbi:helix-turn-helix domain-containing protein [Viridibacillus sp. NPDC096237]|uniref:helix-turn-helix domain-containing protein n=1 Tax=Viridibacillus sp. NPDC096237 TaxID=3390721 RepID=UPI003D0339F3
MKIGSIIRMNRIKKGMTQEELADHIISVSYLSKIENNLLIASNQVNQLLLKKLEIHGIEGSNYNWKSYYDNWIKLLLESFNINEINQAFQKLEEKRKCIVDPDFIINIEIYLIRHYCKEGKIEAAYNQITYLNSVSVDFNREQQYFWNKFRGNVFSLKSNLTRAYISYVKAKELMHYLYLSDSETADLYYSLGVTCSGLSKTTDAIFFISKSLDIYQKNYNIKRCSQCHVTLGISYRRIKNFEEAIKQYKLAIKLASSINDFSQVNLAYINLSHLYSVTGDSKKSIEICEQTLSSSIQINEEDRALLILSLVKENYKNEEFTKAIAWVNKGIHYLNKDVENYEGLKLEFSVYENLLSDRQEHLEILIRQKVIPYFKDRKDYTKLSNYSSLLSSYYAKKKMYKQALDFELLSNNALRNLIEI